MPFFNALTALTDSKWRLISMPISFVLELPVLISLNAWRVLCLHTPLSLFSFWTYKQPSRYRIHDIAMLFTWLGSAAFAANSIKASILGYVDDNKFPI